MKHNAPTVRDVLAVAPNPRMVSAYRLQRLLQVSPGTAQGLKDLAMANFIPTPAESRLMRQLGVNLAEVRAWVALNRAGHAGNHRP